MDVVVEPLSNYPEAVPTVTEWHFSEWGHTDPGGSLEAWTVGLARQAGADQVPGTLIALAGRTPVLYERLGWRAIHTGRYDDIAVTVMRASLPLVPP